MTRRMNLKPLAGARLWAAFVLVLLASAAASGLTLQGPARAATTWVVTMDGSDMGGYSFNPNVIIVSVGDTVNWTDVAGSHTTTSDPGQAESWDSHTMTVGQSFLHTFNTPGNYTYYSTLDGSMTGKVTVAAAVPEFPGPFVFVAVGVAVCLALTLERTLRRTA
jgi:plastocyanin